MGAVRGRSIRSGGRPRSGAFRLAAEFRAQALQIEVERLSRRFIRLRAAARDYLTAIPSDRIPAATRLRHELGHAERMDAAA